MGCALGRSAWVVVACWYRFLPGYEIDNKRENYRNNQEAAQGNRLSVRFIDFLIPTAGASVHLGPLTNLPFSRTTVASTGTRSHSMAYATTLRVWPGTGQMQSCVRLSPRIGLLLREIQTC